MQTARLLFCFAICFCCASVLQAQNLRATVTDKNGNAIPFAEVLLQSLPDSAILKTDIADSLGNINIVWDFKNPLLLTVSSSGFVPERRLIRPDSVTNINAVLSEASTRLAGVTVSATRPLIERKNDRIIFNVEHSISAIGGDAYEALQKAPGVKTSNTEIGLVGKSTVSIMLNDRLLRIGGEELEALLRSIPADNLARIEIITTPPARYDAEGNAGIINIITKKNKQAGFNGNISSRYIQRMRPSHLANGQFNWREGKLNVYGSSALRKFRFTSFQNTITTYPTQKQEQMLDQFHDPLWGRHELGADLQLNRDVVIGMLYTLGTGDTRLEQFYTNNVRQLPSANIDSVSRTYALGGETGRRHILNLNYEWKIDSAGKKLNVDADFFSREGTRRRDFTVQNYLADGATLGLPADNKTIGKQEIKIGAIKADISYPTAFADYTFGGKIAVIDNISDNQFTTRQGNSYINDSNRTNLFGYKEQTQALYLSAEKELGKWEFQAGLRGEYTQTEAISVTINQAKNTSYFKLFPTAYLQYKSSDLHQWNLNYSRRIERPDLEEINPFRSYTTNNSYETGNPFLQPSFAHNLELSYSYKSEFVFTGYATHEQGLFIPVIRVDDNANYFYLTYDNVGTSEGYGFSASFNVQPLPWWETNVQGDGYYRQLTTKYYSPAVTTYTRPSWSAQTTNSFTLNKSKTLLAELGFEYYSDAIEDIDIRSAYSNLEAGIKALLLQKQLVLAISGYDILYTQTYKMRNLYNKAIRNHDMNWQQLSITATWKFGNKYVKEKRQRNTSSEELNRAQ